MAGSLHPLVDLLVQICADRGVYDWIIAPGSRSAPLTVALTRHPQMRGRLIFDERSAAYIALGMAQQLRAPVGLVCTSGTAAVNFAPAVVEAFYQGVPLLVFTADRPPEWIDQQDNQAIHQRDLYAPHVRGSFTLPLDDGKADTAWFVRRSLGQAIDLAGGWEPGPVHINVPLREPLYTPLPAEPDPPAAITTSYPVAMRSIAPRAMASRPGLTEESWTALIEQWRRASRKLIVAGMHPTDAGLRAALTRLTADPGVAVFADVTANLHGLAGVPRHADAILGTRDAATLEALEPDLVINFGGQVTSKNIKTLLRGRNLAGLWHVRPSLVAPDTYQTLTHVIPMVPADFFTELAARLAQPLTDGPGFELVAGDDQYQMAWRTLDAQAGMALGKLTDDAFTEIAAVAQVLAALPKESQLQVGNSMAIRYVNLLGPAAGHYPAQINSNRGTSGIDGTVSTTVGAALAGDAITTLIVGDLGFFYDRNGLWHRHLPANLRIFVLNNHGGGIFDIIDGPNQLERERQETWFLTPQPLTARRTAEDHGLRYYRAASTEDLTQQLPGFFAAGGPALLEIETDMAVNTAAYNRLKAILAGLSIGEGHSRHRVS
jgi:2-succinyl-5-enolpyruvyl-6-hydroxy-3-cyclohexene-1-carboxylate synthase